jgi:hypothetical protein
MFLKSAGQVQAFCLEKFRFHFLLMLLAFLTSVFACMYSFVSVKFQLLQYLMNSLQEQKIVCLEAEIAQYKVSGYGASTIGDKSAHTTYDKMRQVEKSHLLQSCFIERRAHIFLSAYYYVRSFLQLLRNLKKRPDAKKRQGFLLCEKMRE